LYSIDEKQSSDENQPLEIGVEHFDEEYYLFKNQDVALKVGATTAHEHYLRHGRVEGRQPCPRGAHEKAEYEHYKRFGDCYHGRAYLAPPVLARSSTPLSRVVVTGGCQAHTLARTIKSLGIDLEFVNSPGFGALPEYPTHNPYDLQIVWTAVRNVIGEGVFWTPSYADLPAFEKLFAEAVLRLELLVESQLAWNRTERVPVFFCNFLVPQQNPFGRLVPQHDLRNPVYFVARLNQELERIVVSNVGCYVLNINDIAASIGRRYIQDDSIHPFNVTGMLPDDRPLSRMESTLPPTAYYPQQLPLFFRSIWEEVVAMFRIIRQVDSVKMVVFDLDDTLWNGVAAEMDFVSPHLVEGWPLGMFEALAYLKNRGVLLGLISKNDETRVRNIWDQAIGRLFPLEWFAVTKINWQPKIENMRELLAEVNLLPDSVSYVDDNPVERAAMGQAFPELRILDGSYQYWRKTLLWSPETQVAYVTAESANRTDMIKAQIERDRLKPSMTVEEFRSQQQMSIEVTKITLAHPAHSRAFELLNKTNQFNTTGKRWAPEDFAAFTERADVWIIAAEDKYSSYGVVSVVLIEDRMILQMVMSCRVVGYEVEMAALGSIIRLIRNGSEIIRAVTRTTDHNRLSRQLFANLGFEKRADEWVLSGPSPQVPMHVAVRMQPFKTKLALVPA
jgi:FkbH-like protein